jgi:hypothetical protein
LTLLSFKSMMSMQLAVKPKEKEKGNSRRPTLADANRVQAMINSSFEITEQQIGERLQQGVMKRLREHALQREAMNARDIDALLRSSSETAQ